MCSSNCVIQLSTRTGSSPDIFVTDDGSSPTRMNHRYASSDASGTSPDSVRIPTHNYKVSIEVNIIGRRIHKM